VGRANRHHVAGLDLVAGFETFSVGLDYFFGDGLGHVEPPVQIINFEL
jgi:hypothetical protein